MAFEEKIGTGWADLFTLCSLNSFDRVDLTIDQTEGSPTNGKLIPVQPAIYLGYSAEVNIPPTIQKNTQKAGGRLAPTKSKLSSVELAVTAKLIFNRDPDVEQFFRPPGDDFQYEFTFGTKEDLMEPNLLVIEYSEHLPDIARCIILFRGQYQPVPISINRASTAIPCQYQVLTGLKNPPDSDCPYRPKGSDLGKGWWVYRLAPDTLYNPRTKMPVPASPIRSKHIPLYPTLLVLPL